MLTRFRLLKLIRLFVYERFDSIVRDVWMPRAAGPYKELYVFTHDGRRFHITIEEDRWYE